MGRLVALPAGRLDPRLQPRLRGLQLADVLRREIAALIDLLDAPVLRRDGCIERLPRPHRRVTRGCRGVAPSRERPDAPLARSAECGGAHRSAPDRAARPTPRRGSVVPAAGDRRPPEAGAGSRRVRACRSRPGVPRPAASWPPARSRSAASRCSMASCDFASMASSRSAFRTSWLLIWRASSSRRSSVSKVPDAAASWSASAWSSRIRVAGLFRLAGRRRFLADRTSGQGRGEDEPGLTPTRPLRIACATESTIVASNAPGDLGGSRVLATGVPALPDRLEN